MPEPVSALFSDYTQTTRLLRLSTPLGPDRLLAECVHGEEAISEGYAFTISALSLDAAIPLRALVGQPALLELLTAHDGVRRPFHGYLARGDGTIRYRIAVSPKRRYSAR